MSNSAIEELSRTLPVGVVETDPSITDAYRQDGASFCAAGKPLAVVRPSATKEVQEVMRWATRHRVPVVPQAALTGRSGAANAVDGGIVLSLKRMNRILEIDAGDRVAVVEPGVVNADLSRAVDAQGLFYPPDPSSWESSTIGGNLATNSGGLCCVKYGVTSDFVRALEVVLPDGEVMRTGRRTAKGVAGLDLTKLLVGSEGTLGIITEATLGLMPRSGVALTLAAVFADVPAALTAAQRIVTSGVRPSLLEFLDGVTIRAVQQYRDMGLPVDANALLIMQSDRGPQADDDIAQIERICRAADAVEVARADDERESEMLLEARRLVGGGAVDQLGATFVEDVVVPRAQLGNLMTGVAEIAARRSVMIATSGHIGDCNMHPTIVFERGDADALDRAQKAFGDIMGLALDLGGTITGEHRVGLLKRSWLRKEIGDVNYELQRRIKASFDPLGLLNPGKVL